MEKLVQEKLLAEEGEVPLIYLLELTLIPMLLCRRRALKMKLIIA